MHVALLFDSVSSSYEINLHAIFLHFNLFMVKGSAVEVIFKSFASTIG